MSDNIVEAEDKYWEEHDRRLAMGWPGKQDENAIHYNDKLAGVVAGEGRQDIIKVLNGNELLRVRREADNKFDSNAVAVDVQFGEDWAHIGYIGAKKNKDIAAALDAGKEVFIGIASLTGGGDKSYGVNVEIEYTKVKDDAKVNSGAEVAQNGSGEVSEAISHDTMVLNSIKSLLGIKENKESYTSRLIGKTTEVTVTNGHISIPGYLSGSKFPEQFYPEFNEDEILGRILTSYYPKANEAKQEDIKKALLEMWDINRIASTSYGTAIHAALENYDRFYKLGDKTKTVKVLKTKTNVGPNKALSKNPFLKKIVEDFHELFGGDYIRLNEQFIWSHEAKLCGSIDRVKVIDAEKRIIRIQDFKTDGDIHETKYQNADSIFRGVGKKALKEGKKEKPNTVEDTLLGLHWLQLSFYAHILTKYYGYTVEGLDVYWLNPSKLVKGENAWEEFSHEVIDIEKGL